VIAAVIETRKPVVSVKAAACAAGMAKTSWLAVSKGAPNQ